MTLANDFSSANRYKHVHCISYYISRRYEATLGRRRSSVEAAPFLAGPPRNMIRLLQRPVEWHPSNLSAQHSKTTLAQFLAPKQTVALFAGIERPFWSPLDYGLGSEVRGVNVAQ